MITSFITLENRSLMAPSTTPSTALVPSPAPASVPVPLFAPTPKAAKRVFEFFTTQLNNDHTRKAYKNATRRFAQWCERHGIKELAAVEPSHIAAFIKQLERQFTPPTVKQHLRGAAYAVRLAGDRPRH